MVKVEIDNDHYPIMPKFKVVVEFDESPQTAYEYESEQEALTFAVNKIVNERRVVCTKIERTIHELVYSIRRECE